MIGLCHSCLRSGVELEITKEEIICKDCLDKNNAKN